MIDFEEERYDLIEYVLKVFLGIVRRHKVINWDLDTLSTAFGPKGKGLGFDPECDITYISGEGKEAVYELFLGIKDYISIDRAQYTITEVQDALIKIYENEPIADIDHGNGMTSEFHKKEALQVLRYIEKRFGLESELSALN